MSILFSTSRRKISKTSNLFSTSRRKVQLAILGSNPNGLVVEIPRNTKAENHSVQRIMGHIEGATHTKFVIHV